MNILVTGSSGWLGQTLVPRLKTRRAYRDRARSGAGADHRHRRLRGRSRHGAARIRDHAIQAIVHAGALHKPHVATHDTSRFVAVNVQGTLNLLEEATAPGSPVDRFVFTSTTSLMISPGDPRRRTGAASIAPSGSTRT